MTRRGPRIEEPQEFYFPLRGGLDLVTPQYQIHPGKMVDCFRYEIAPSGGAKPIDGFERVDGLGLPSQATYQYLEYAEAAVEIPVGTTVTGSVSGAIGISLMTGEYDFGDGDGVESMAGKGVFLMTSLDDFEAGDSLLDGATPLATVATAFSRNIEMVESHEHYYRWLAVEKLRSMISVVPGDGPVRGVWHYKGNLYAFRDNEAGTACVMFREDATTGWAAVSGVPALLPGGSYRFINTNFGGAASTVKMYGCDRVNKAFEFDGTTFTQITTGMVADTPIHIYEHKKHLFLAFPNGSLQHSPPTDPTGTWTVVTNAGELGMGEEITGLLGLPGGALGIWCTDSIHILYGSGADVSSGDAWSLTPHTKESGGIAGTIQNAGRILFLNNTGLADLQATNAYGSFKSGTVSAAIKPLLDRRKGLAVNSVVVADKNQYRLFFSDGFWISVDLTGKYPQFTKAHYDKPICCIAAPKRADDELGAVYFGSDDGFIYRMDSGVSLDETPMAAYFRLPFTSQGHPRLKKRYREVVVEIDAYSSDKLVLSFSPDYSMSNPHIPDHGIVDVSREQLIGGGLWNIDNWDEFQWSGHGVGDGMASGRIDGVSTEIGLLVYFHPTDTITPLHILNGIFIYFNLYGRQR